MSELKRLLKSGRIIILILVLIFSLVAIYPNFWNKGVAIRTVIKDGPAYAAGIESPKPTASPMSREKITSINNIPINNIDDYDNVLGQLAYNVSAQVKTNKKTYMITPEYRFEVVATNETELMNKTKEVFDEALNKTVNKTESYEVPKKKKVYYKDELSLGLSVYNAPTTNVRKGLDLEGGTRVLLQPEEKVSDDMLDSIIMSMEQRLNVYGISDVSIRPASDLSGNQFIRVEIAGATEEEVRSLLETQGKFEAKVGQKTVFLGGNDITYVCRTADCSGLDAYQGCNQYQDGWACTFRFSIALSPEAAKRQAEATKDLKIITKYNEPYLNETLDLYLDDQPVDSLNIGADLKGRVLTDIAISGSGTGKLKQDAANNALQNMKKLQTILVTGSLPVKINIVKIDSISPVLGKEFGRSALIMALLSAACVIIIIFIKYREIRITLPIAITLVSEIIIIFGVAALIGWNIDLAAIAGIIVAVGTGVDDQIIITDETLKGEAARLLSWKQKFKRAFFIIMAAYFANLVAMIPLLFAGAGLLKGFAITSIIGISAGVFITRPAYAAIVEVVLRHKEEVKAE